MIKAKILDDPAVSFISYSQVLRQPEMIGGHQLFDCSVGRRRGCYFQLDESDLGDFIRRTGGKSFTNPTVIQRT